MAKKFTQKDRFQAIFNEFNIPAGSGKRKEILAAIGDGAKAHDLYKYLRQTTGLNQDKTFLQFVDEKPKMFPKNALPSTEDRLKDIYTSEEFQNLSPIQQQLIKDTIQNFDPGQLNKIGLSDGEKKAIATEAWNRATETYKITVDQLNQDREEALRQDTVILQRNLDQQKAIYDNAIANNDLASAEAAKVTLAQLSQALDKATEEYGIAAERKNTDLATRLSDVQKELNTTTTRTNEDKVIQLRQAERQLQNQLTAVQDNMSQRGFTYSTPRIKAEEDVNQNYNDTVTTAQLVAKRAQDDARLKAEQEIRDAKLAASRDVADLLRYYSGQEKSAIQGAETTLGTPTISGAISGRTGVSGDLTKNLYGGLQGTVNTAKEQEALNAQRGFTSGIQNAATAYESAYGSKQAREIIGNKNPLYSVIGGLEGSTNIDLQRKKEAAQQQRNVDTEAIKQAEESSAFYSKI